MLTRRSHWNDFEDLGLGRFGRSFAGLEQLRREMDRLFGEFEQQSDGHWRSTAWPRIGVIDEGKTVLVRAELPGMTEKDLEITVTADTLTLRGKRQDEVPEGYSVHRKERAAIEFARSVQLPCRVDGDKAEAIMKHGVLSLKFPKAAEAQPKQITVKAL